MQMTLEQVKTLVMKSNFKFVKVLDSKGHKLAIKCGTAKTEEPTPEEICTFLDEFYKNHPGAYTLECKTYHSSPNTEKYVYTAVTNQAAVALGSSPSFTPVHINEEALKKKITAEIRETFRIEEKERQRQKAMLDLLSETKKKNDELDTIAGKLMVIGTKMFNQFVKNNPAVLGMLQGSPDTESNTTMETAPLRDLQNVSPEDQAKINMGLTLFLKHMHPDLLLKFAEKIDSNPAIVSQLQTFI